MPETLHCCDSIESRERKITFLLGTIQWHFKSCSVYPNHTKVVPSASAVDAELNETTSLFRFRKRTQRRGQHPLLCQPVLRNTNLLQPSHRPLGLPGLMPFTCSSPRHFLVKQGQLRFLSVCCHLRARTASSLWHRHFYPTAQVGMEPCVLPFVSNSIKKLWSLIRNERDKKNGSKEWKQNLHDY